MSDVRRHAWASQHRGKPSNKRALAESKKENRPGGRLEKWRPSWGQERAAIYLNAAPTRRFQSPNKKGRRAVAVLRFQSAVWLDRGQPATHPCAWTAVSIPRR